MKRLNNVSKRLAIKVVPDLSEKITLRKNIGVHKKHSRSSTNLHDQSNLIVLNCIDIFLLYM